jgi:hypothetical protein
LNFRAVAVWTIDQMLASLLLESINGCKPAIEAMSSETEKI